MENCKQLKMLLVNWHLLLLYLPETRSIPSADSCFLPRHIPRLELIMHQSCSLFTALELYLWSMHSFCALLFAQSGAPAQETFKVRMDGALRKLV